MTRTTDMTTGSPRKHLVAFAAPLFVGYIFQQLYTVADGAVVGRLIGANAFAAVGAAGFLSWMVTSIIMGFTQGFGILYAQRFGGKQMEGLKKGVAISLILAGVLGAFLMIFGLVFAEPILSAVDTPAAIAPGALLYLQWFLSGTLISMAYNVAATLLRALGDSKTPVYALMISGVSNVLLDLLFVSVFSMGIPSVALATVLSQLLSLCLCLIQLRRIREVRITRKDFAWDGATAWELLRLGFPLAFRDGVIAVGGLIVQSVINGYGWLFVAGTTAAKKYFDLMSMVSAAFEGAAATFVAQNYGANKLTRIRKGMHVALRIELVGAVLIGVLSVCFAPWLLSLLVTGTPEEMAEILEAGTRYMLATAICLPFLYLLCLYRSGLQGMGNSLFPMLSGFMELGLRIVAVLALPVLIGQWGVFFAEGIGWIGAFLLLILAYYWIYRKRAKQQALKNPQEA